MNTGGYSMTGRQKRILLGLFAAWFLYALLFTPAGDDMERIRFVEYRFADILSLIPEQYLTLNGRVIGNFLSFLLIQPVWLRALTKAVTVTVIAHSLWKIAGLKSTASLIFTFLLVTAMPLRIHVQVYAWSAGFFNYTIPMAILLWFFARMKDKTKPKAWQAALAGFSSCLFVEHVTAFLLLVAAGILFLHYKKWSHPVLFPFALGIIAGAVVLGASPGYRNVIEGDDWYRRVPVTRDSIQQQLFKNIGRFGPYVLARQLFLPVLLFASVLVVVKNRADRIIWIALFFALGFLFWPSFAQNRFTEGLEYQPWLTVLTHQVVHAAILIFLFVRVTPQLPKKDRPLFRGGIAAWLFLYAPLVIVQPIGPRNFYAATLALVLLVLLLVKHAGVFRWKQAGKVSLALLAVLLLWRGGIHFSNTRVYLARDAHIREAMRQQDQAVMLSPFPYLSYMHGSQTEGLENLYFYRKPGDLYFYMRPDGY